MRTTLPNDDQNNGMSGSFRLLGAVLILAFAGLGTGIVLDLVSLESAGELAKQVALIGCICALAVIGLGIIGFSRPRS